MATAPTMKPTKTGFEFAGWYPSKTATTPFDFNTPITAITTIVAKWDQLFTLTYNVNGGTGSAPQPEQYKSGESATIKGIGFISRDGCTCKGWGDGKQTYTAGDKLPTLYAVWWTTVTFDVQGGSPQPSPVEVLLGGSLSDVQASLPSAPSKQSNTFIGWFYGTTPFTAAIKVTSPSITVTAKWQIDQYTVILDANGGQGTPPSVQVDAGGSLSVAQPTRTGYNFIAWSTSKDSYYQVGPINYNITVYALWEIIRCKVTFISQDLTATKREFTVDYGSPLPLPGSFSYWTGAQDYENRKLNAQNCIYRGWYTDPVGGTGANDTVVGNITVYTHQESCQDWED
jgi:uncharacterized repeat protein (TIGR02543 family)